MNRRRWMVVVAVLCGAVLSGAAATPEEASVDAAKATLDDLTRTDPNLKTHLSKAVGYVVFPEIKKGAFVIGGAGGTGVLFEKNNAVGTATMKQVTVGAQAGGEKYSELILFETPAALETFKKGKLAFAAGMSAVAAGEGASANIRYERGVAVMTRPTSGLMAEISVGTQKFTFEPYKKPSPSM